MIKDFLRIASIIARQDFQVIANNKATKKTRLMNVLQWNETIKAYKDKKLKKYSDIHSSCYWKDMTYSEYKGKKGDFRNGFTKKETKISKRI